MNTRGTVHSGIIAALMLSLALMSAAPAKATEPLPPEIFAQTVKNIRLKQDYILVDLRMEFEKPSQPPNSGFDVQRVVWPQRNNKAALTKFYADLKTLQDANPGKSLILFCASGVRTRFAMSLMPQSIRNNGIVSHVVGGLYGNARDPGLLRTLR